MHEQETVYVPEYVVKILVGESVDIGEEELARHCGVEIGDVADVGCDWWGGVERPTRTAALLRAGAW